MKGEYDVAVIGAGVGRKCDRKGIVQIQIENRGI